MFDKYKNNIDLNKCENDGTSPFWIACQNNHVDLIKFLLKHNVSKDKININLQENNGTSPLMMAVQEGNEETVSLLCKLSNVKILDLKNNYGRNTLDLAVYFGHISIFSLLVLTLFERYNVKNFNDLIELNIFDKNNVLKWFKWCQDEKNTGFTSFLLKLDENGLKKEKFSIVLSHLESNVSINKNSELYSNYNLIRKNDYIAKYLFDNVC